MEYCGILWNYIYRKENQILTLTDTFPLCHCEKTLFALPTFFLRSNVRAPKILKAKSGEWQTGRVGEKEKNGKVGVVPLGSKASCLPSTLGHSLCATLAFGGMGVNCHWCHSAVNHAVTRSDALRVVERKPPAKRHRGKKSPPVYPHQRATWLANKSRKFSSRPQCSLAHNWTRSDVLLRS